MLSANEVVMPEVQTGVLDAVRDGWRSRLG